jgi:hypothetical protein
LPGTNTSVRGRHTGDHERLIRHEAKTAVSGITWVPEGDLALAQWLEYGRRLGQLGRGVAWWIGDWLRYGNLRYGEKYSRAARATGYDAQSLMNMAYVASRFPPERRRDQLSWSHHAEVAALMPAEQDRWLDLAEAERLSVHSLRLEVRTSRRVERHGLPERRSEVEVARARTRSVVCPRCRHVLDVH